MRNHVRVALAATSIAALAAGGAAFTASNTQPANQIVGYGSTTVTGATVSSLAYVLSANGATVTSVTLVLAGDTTASNVSIGFNGGAIATCGVGVFTTDTTYNCDGAGTVTSTLVSTEVVAN
jgi:uncharacterized protein YvpB